MYANGMGAKAIFSGYFVLFCFDTFATGCKTIGRDFLGMLRHEANYVETLSEERFR